MKAISLWQPWASLVVQGIKTVETRSWPVPPELIGWRVAIHATRTRVITDHIPFLLPDQIAYLPVGKIVGSAVIKGCVGTSDQGALGAIYRHASWHGPTYDDPGDYELILGDYSPNRYAWLLTDPRELEEPVPFSGRQRFFDVPDDLLAGTIQSR